MAQNTLRQAIQTWQQRLELTGMGLVETTLQPKMIRDHSTCAATILHASIDATLAHLARLTPSQFTVELAYPWGREDGNAGALLGIFPEPFDEAIDFWSEVDAA